MTAQHSYKMKANFKVNQLKKKKDDNSRNKLPGLECKQFCFSIMAASGTVTVVTFILHPGSWKDLTEVC